MSPKRKIPSRKLPSRKFASSRPNTSKPSSSQPNSFKSTSSTAKRPAQKKPLPREVVQPPQPTVAQCFWDMGFESVPTLEELRQRYKELSLVLHPDAGGNKQAFVDLRTNYEAALAILT